MQSATPTIEAASRPRVGSVHAQRLRKSGRLPGVIYGHKRDPVAISVDEKEMLEILRRGAHVLTVQVQGAEPETCLVKDIQFGYLGDNVIHVDLARVDLQEEVTVRVHLAFVGQPKSATEAGAILAHDMTDLEVTCRVSDIPSEIKVDLTAMGERSLLTVGDLVLPPNVRVEADLHAPVVHISFVKHEETPVVGEAAEVAAGPAEPEVITEAKPKEEEETES